MFKCLICQLGYNLEKNYSQNFFFPHLHRFSISRSIRYFYFLVHLVFDLKGLSDYLGEVIIYEIIGRVLHL